jgi:hypothetical protein
MMEIYPYGGLWAYLKFHFIDGITKQSLMLLDKTRIDYDAADKKKGKVHKSKVQSGANLSDMMKGFGIGTDVEMTDSERADIISKELEKQ